MKISIIIPTRERADYLSYSLQTALEIEDDNVEIIVSDNFSTDHTRDVIEKFSDKRLKYINTGKRVSMRENFNSATLKSTGDYIIFFGDDDGILPKQFKYLRRILEKHKPDGVSWVKSTYLWPNDEYGAKTGGRIRFYGPRSYGVPYEYNPQKKHIDNLMQCRLKSLRPATPNIYHGCVSRVFLEKNASEKDVLFDSTIPDVNFEYRTIMLGGKFIHSDHAFSINGDSAVSNGRAHGGYDLNDPRTKPAQKFHQENENDPYLNVFGNQRFTPLLLMATLETLRERMPDFKHQPNMVEWYSYVYNLSKQQTPKETFQIIVKSLKEYAARTGTLDDFNVAECRPYKKTKKTWGDIKARLKLNLSTFSLSAEKDGENTILSAVRLYDEILGDGYEHVLNNPKTYKTEWRKAKARYKKAL
ncbi:glycosyltransferase family 2 protein [Amylibacter sp. SFDW26]|uniref:glycosyltransferase family 2 protein n=1 Tax=Amylibacter sp. SFDW26 TaxID=2652722 RepID=UPI00186A3D8E|nr:glycosyltransferase family 2 protein [Amylibacter sp. SFDW26]